MDNLWKKYTIADGVLSNLVYSSAIDKNGNLWFGCKNPNGAVRFDGKKWAGFTAQNCGIGSGHIWDITVDDIGNIWFATAGGGISKFDSVSWKNFTKNDGLAGDHVYTVKADKDGKIWCGCAPPPDKISRDGGVSVFDGKTFTNYTSDFTFGEKVGGGNSGLCDNKVYALVFDLSGNVWFGSKGNGICKFDGNSWITYDKKAGIPVNEVGDGAAFVDNDNNVWFGTRGGGLCKYDGFSWYNFTKKDGLAGDFVYAINFGPDGNMWIGCAPDPARINRDGGISIYDGSEFNNFKSDYTGGKYVGGGNCPLTDNRVYTITFDEDGNGWFGTKGGGISLFSAPGIKNR